MFYKNARKLFVIASLSLLAILLSSCGLWRNFTTYFNTYYNAKTLFDKTEEEILKQKKDIFAFREDVNTLGSTSGSSYNQTNYQNQNSYNQNNYNQNNYNQNNSNQDNYQNQNNFQNQNTSQYGNNQYSQYGNQNTTQYGSTSSGKSSSLGTGQFGPDLKKVIEKCSKILQYDKESAYFADALFIIGKAFYYQQEYASAQRKFLELAGLPDSKYALENKLWLAKTYLQLRSFDDGLKLIEEVKAEALKEDNKKLYTDASITKISFYVFREEYQNAIDECKSLLNASIDDETSALVSYELGKIYLVQKDNKNALEAFASVLKYSPDFEVEYRSRMEHAKLLKALGKIDESEDEFRTLRSMGKFRNYLDEILVELGNIFYDKNQIEPAIELFREVDSTYRAKPSAGLADVKLGEIYEKKYRDYDSSYKYYIKSVSMLADKDLKARINDKVRNIDKYRQFKSTINKDLGDLSYVKDPVKFDRDSIDYDVAYRQYLDENKKLIEQQQQNSGQGGLRNEQDQFAVQQQMLQQQQMAQQQKKKKDEKDMTISELIAAGKLKKPVRPKMSADSLNTILSEDYYNLGSLFFSELEVPDSAKVYFQKILNEYGSKPVAVKTMFAMGTYYETENDTVKADSIFKFIYEKYPDNPLRKAVVEKLGLDKKDEEQVVEQKTDDPARKIYLNGESLYYDKKYREALDIFRSISRDYPKSEYAPKAIYYVGMIYENNIVQNDSAAAAYGQLINDFKTSPLANLVMAKYTNYETEQKKIQLEEQKKINPNSGKSGTTGQPNVADSTGHTNTIEQTAPPQTLPVSKKDSINPANTVKKEEIEKEEKKPGLLKEEKPASPGLSGKEFLKDKDTLKPGNRLLKPGADTLKKSIEERRKLLLEDNIPVTKPDSSKVKKNIPR